jgi:hypothetical protein
MISSIQFHGILPLNIWIIDFFLADPVLVFPGIQLPFLDAERHCHLQFLQDILRTTIALAIFGVNKLYVHFLPLVEFKNVVPAKIIMLGPLSHLLMFTQESCSRIIVFHQDSG